MAMVYYGRKKSMKFHKHLYGPATVNEKGQVVIPADARHDLNITPDMKLMVVGDPKHQVLVMLPMATFEKKMQSFVGRFFMGGSTNQ